ncbi:LPXTG cell wall anchor domain-containing protein [Staphylococcus shinii]|nr:LPXTG cell wall anchor domain-containing protein [Staphylococcus shinii]
MSTATSESTLPNGIISSDNIDENNLLRNNSSDNQHNLPETGEHKSEGLFGAVLAFLVGLGLIRKSKKSRKDKDK